MPIPHQEMRRIIKRRIVGTEGQERLRILRDCLSEMPDFNGPYADLRRWVQQLMEQTQTRKATKHQDQFSIPKEGCAQVVLVGPPNAGKSSLLKALTGRQVVIGSYAFTTLRPIAGTLTHGGASLQIVDLPGLIAGAANDAGGGRAVLSCIRSADLVLYVVPATEEGMREAQAALAEIGAIPHPRCGMIITKADLASPETIAPLAKELLPSVPTMHCSATTGEGLDQVSSFIWSLTGLIRAYPKPRGKEVAVEPIVLPLGATVQDFVLAIHKVWLKRFRQAKITGPSAKFDSMPVSLNHILQDGDMVELILRG